MSLEKLKIGIVGGSISGCAAAIAFLRAGHDVEVFERSAVGLADRGAGIAIPGPLKATLIDRGYLPATYRTVPMRERWWQYPDGSALGRTLWTQPTPATTNNWGLLWAALRANVPDNVYHGGVALTRFEADGDAVTAEFSDACTRRFDLLVAADGYRSSCRHWMHPEAAPAFAGYVLWRGNYPVHELVDRSVLDALDPGAAWLTVPFQGGHGVLYQIPDADPGARRVNWAIYAPVPDGLVLNGVTSISPGNVAPDVFGSLETLLNDAFPPRIAALVRHSRREDVSIQPIFDSVVDTYVAGRVMLVGDAGSMTRPHTASGATKALEDVLAIARFLDEAEDVSRFLAAYDAERCGAARAVSEIGRRIGQAQVVSTPDWGSMAPADFEAWIAATLSGDKLYLYGESEGA